MNTGVFLLSSDSSAIAFAMFSIFPLKSEMAFVTKSKEPCRSMLSSEDTSHSGESKMDRQLWKQKEKHNITTARLTELSRSVCQSVDLQEMNVILSERQLLQFILRLPHLRNLPLQTLHESLGSAHRSFLLNSDQLVYRTTPFVRHQDDFSIGLFILVNRCIPRTLIVERNDE